MVLFWREDQALLFFFRKGVMPLKQFEDQRVLLAQIWNRFTHQVQMLVTRCFEKRSEKRASIISWKTSRGSWY